MDGILVVNKPPDITSFKVVEKIKKRFHFKKAGHAGTLDPFATGVLIVMIDRATKIFEILSNTDKCYSGKIMLGIETDTQDRTKQPLTYSSFFILTSRIKFLFNLFQYLFLYFIQSPFYFSSRSCRMSASAKFLCQLINIQILII